MGLGVSERKAVEIVGRECRDDGVGLRCRERQVGIVWQKIIAAFSEHVVDGEVFFDDGSEVVDVAFQQVDVLIDPFSPSRCRKCLPLLALLGAFHNHAQGDDFDDGQRDRLGGTQTKVWNVHRRPCGFRFSCGVARGRRMAGRRNDAGRKQIGRAKRVLQRVAGAFQDLVSKVAELILELLVLSAEGVKVGTDRQPRREADEDGQHDPAHAAESTGFLLGDGDGHIAIAVSVLRARRDRR
mmetsp:Transcript_2190/g.5594  ORF Transcript_2190/g.5594 Transcript_2190/m.5594 type:complete len:240 (+) Transcript_2190:597-1316(+)